MTRALAGVFILLNNCKQQEITKGAIHELGCVASFLHIGVVQSKTMLYYVGKLINQRRNKMINSRQDALQNDIDFYFQSIEYYSTAFGGDPDEKSIKQCELIIKELQEKLEEL